MPWAAVFHVLVPGDFPGTPVFRPGNWSRGCPSGSGFVRDV